MLLNDYYDLVEAPKSDRIKAEKNIMLIVPDKDHDIQPVLDRMGVSKFEVAITYPKPGVNMLAEVCTARPLVVAQVDQQFSKKWDVIGSDGDWDVSFEKRIQDAVTDRFVALHHHDEFSIKDGLGTIEQLIKILKAQRRSYCCVTNHGNVGGWIRQYNACREAGIKPIFGMEAYMKRDRVKERSANHLILLANNEKGFYNIIQIHNDAQVNGFYYDPRANWECIEKWGEGIIGTSACFAGEIPRFLMDTELSEEDRFAKAKEVYDFYNGSFDQFYVELQIIEFEEQRELNRRLVEFTRKVEGEFILACDSHYLEAEQADTHDLLMMARQGKTVLDKMADKEDVWNFEVRNLYYRNAEQMETTYKIGFDAQELVADEDGIMERTTIRQPGFLDDVFTEEVFEQAMANTHKVARDCEDIKLDDSVKLPKLYDNSPDILREKVNEGFKELGLHKFKNKQEYKDRLAHEFDIIKRLGWPDYFLVMDYIVKWTVENFGEWAVGYGRGSAAGSLIAYCLRLTYIDPLEHGLLFERFLDESRPDPPDIDTDFDPRIRPQVKSHIISKFGEDYTCSIGTYQTYKTKAVIVEMARVLGLDVHEAESVTKKMDSLQAFEDDEGEEEKVDKMSFEDLEKHYPELKEYFELYPEVKLHAKILRNQVKNMGKHAGGVIISDLNLKGRIPVQLDKDGNIISSWAESGNSSELSKVGLVKYDILGLNNLPVIADCIALVKKHRGIDIKRDDVPIDDRESILMGSKRDLVGIFQFENPATREIVDATEMETLNDVSAITSLLRPGPKDMGMHMEYARRKHGGTYEMPDFMRDALAETFGVITYQEQCMRIAQILSMFTGPESNKLRKAIGKKLEELMAEMKEKFIKGAKTRIDAGEISEEEVVEIWEQLEAFAGYGFNKSHAVAYSAITTAQLWLKYHYPVEFITALANNTKQGKKKKSIGVNNLLVHYLNYGRKRGFEVLKPDVNKSTTEFTIEDKNIRFSLAHIKKVATNAEHIVALAPYADMKELYEKCVYKTATKTGKNIGRIRTTRPNKGVIESLIAAGAFDDMPSMALWPTGEDLDVVRRRNVQLAEYYAVKNGKKEDPPEYTKKQWRAKEIEAIGMCLSEPPLFKQWAELIAKRKWTTMDEAGDKERVTMFGQIMEIRAHTSKKGNPMHIVSFSDGIDAIDFFVFEGGRILFFDTYKTGNICAIPLKKFEDGDTRFFDEYRDGQVIVP